MVNVGYDGYISKFLDHGSGSYLEVKCAQEVRLESAAVYRTDGWVRGLNTAQIPPFVD